MVAKESVLETKSHVDVKMNLAALTAELVNTCSLFHKTKVRFVSSLPFYLSPLHDIHSRYIIADIFVDMIFVILIFYVLVLYVETTLILYTLMVEYAV